MVRVVGIDPGTKSFDFCGLDDGRLLLQESVPSTTVGENPKIVIEILQKAQPLDLVVAPSGYGLPLIHVREISEDEKILMVLTKKDDSASTKIAGLRTIVDLLRQSQFNAYVIPGVIHLPTIPLYRKINKIDMGTADKLCCVALGIHDQARHLRIPVGETSFILCEIGFGYTAVMGVENGQVTDGIGGTSGGPGFLAMGSLDGELAYILNGFKKDLLFQGGAASIAGISSPSPDDLIKRAGQNNQCKAAYEMLLSSIEKSVASVSVSVSQPKEILLSGRLSRLQRVSLTLSRRLRRFGTVRRVSGFTRQVKEAAQGAAIIGDGLAGGKWKGLVDNLAVKRARGTCLDYVYVSKIEELRERLGLNRNN